MRCVIPAVRAGSCSPPVRGRAVQAGTAAVSSRLAGACHLRDGDGGRDAGEGLRAPAQGAGLAVRGVLG